MSEIYALPCHHPACETKKFYMKYTLFKPESESFHYFLADTKKLIAQIQQDDPKMIDHAHWKYKNERPERWLEFNCLEHAPNIGTFAFNRYVNFEARYTYWEKLKVFFHKTFVPSHVVWTVEAKDETPALTMNTGHACMLITIQELGLPFVPISVHREEGDEKNIEQLKILIGYDREVEPVPYFYDLTKLKIVEETPYLRVVN